MSWPNGEKGGNMTTIAGEGYCDVNINTRSEDKAEDETGICM